MIGTKTYTLTLNECVDALLKKKLTPKRLLAPGLLMISGGLAMLATPVFLMEVKWARSPFVDKGWVDYRSWYIAYIICGIACISGILLWRWEGNTSLQRTVRRLRAYYREQLTPKEVTFNDEVWTVRHENGSEDKRKFSNIKFAWEKSETFCISTDVTHIFPKRIFSEQELEQLRKLCLIEVGVAGAAPQRRRESVLNAFVGILEYALWRRRFISAVVVIAPLFFTPWAFMSTYENPRSGLTEYKFTWWKIITTIAVWYCVILLYNFFVALRFAMKVRYESIGETGFSFLFGKKVVFAQWARFSDAHEGFSCFLFEITTGSYQLFCKRVFTQPEQTLLRNKISLVKRGPPTLEEKHA